MLLESHTLILDGVFLYPRCQVRWTKPYLTAVVHEAAL